MESDIIYVGRLIKSKNIDVLIRSMHMAIQEVPGLTCLIIGNGPERDYLLKLTADLDLNGCVTFRDFCDDYGEVISYMKSSKVFALPSTREGFGIVAVEANACGLPVVTVEHEMNAASDLVNERNGFIAQFTAEDFSKKILLAFHQSFNMKDGCIESAKKYDWNSIAASLELCYAGLK